MLCFVHQISRFRFLDTFGDEVTKIRKYYVIFAYILQGKMGKTQKKWKENHATKVTKIPKTKRRKYGMNETIIINQKPYLIANRAVKRMVNQQKFHDTFTCFPGKI